MATRINKGPIKLLLYELVLVLFCLNKKKHKIFQADRNDYMVNRLSCKNFLYVCPCFPCPCFPCPRFPCPRFPCPRFPCPRFPCPRFPCPRFPCPRVRVRVSVSACPCPRFPDNQNFSYLRQHSIFLLSNIDKFKYRYLYCEPNGRDN